MTARQPTGRPSQARPSPGRHGRPGGEWLRLPRRGQQHPPRHDRRRLGVRQRLARRRRRTRLGLLVLLGLLSGVLLTTARPWTAVLPAAPAAPRALQQAGLLGSLTAGQGHGRVSITLAFAVPPTRMRVIPDVEVVARGRARAAPLSVQGPLLPPSARTRTVRLRVGPLVGGRAYGWQVRLRTLDGRSSPWVAFGGHQGAAAFRVPRFPPAPVLTSSTHPQGHAWSTTPVATLTWTPAPATARIVGYAVRLDRRADGVPAPRVSVRRPRVQVRVPTDGRWYVHVRARDASGVWSAVATDLLQVDRHPLALRDVRFPHLAFDPDVEGEPLVATIQGVAWLRLQVYVQGTPQVVRTLAGGLHSGTTSVTWDGRDQQGHLLPEGSYRLVLTATDPFGRQAVADYSDIVLLRRRVVVSLRQQRLVAYAGTRAVARTLVTTGNRRLPTPVGIFHILAVYHPFTMVSPWPPSSPDYYAPVHLRDALLFDERGFFIHDAPWRHRFGPGSNALAGRPGQDRTGTHGCVNVPAGFAAWLVGWAPVGTAVVIGP